MLTTSAMAAGRASLAADWNGTLQATVDGAYVTNPRMLAGADNSSDETGQLMFDGNAIAQTERGELTITPRVLLTRYNHQTDLDTNAGSLGLAFQENLERGKWSFDGMGSTDSTLTSELGTTGITYVNRRHTAGSADLGYQYSSTERLSWLAQVSGQITRYEDATAFGLVNYDYGSVQFGPNWSFSERLLGSLTLEANRLNPDAGARQTDYGVSAQLRRDFSERYAWRISLGSTRVDYSSTGSSPSSSSTTVEYDIGANYKGERVQWDLSAKRAVLPIGVGLLAPETVASLVVVANVSEYGELRLSLNGIRTDSVYVVGIPVYTGATWGQASVEWRYHFTPHWAISAGYQQARSRADNVQEWANGKQAQLGVVWDSGRL
jgi:hypothetical protein